MKKESFIKSSKTSNPGGLNQEGIPLEEPLQVHTEIYHTLKTCRERLHN